MPFSFGSSSRPKCAGWRATRESTRSEMRILVVEDDKRLGPEIVAVLRRADYAVDLACSAEEAEFLGETEPYDAVVLDVGLPDRDGLSVLKTWRGKSIATPVLVLTARDQFADLVAGFRS